MTFSDHEPLSPQASAELEMFYLRSMSECVLLVAALSGTQKSSASITKPESDQLVSSGKLEE